MVTIEKIEARPILDSAGFPTLEGVLNLSNGKFVKASIPSSFSSGKRFAFELRDEKDDEFGGLGVKKAVYYINSLIGPKLKGVSPEKQREIDYWLIKADNTPNKSTLGGNTILLVSTLVTKAAALTLELPIYVYINQMYLKFFKEKLPLAKIPRPIINVVDGGRHAKTVDFQEYYVFFPDNLSLESIFNQFFSIKEQIKKLLTIHSVGMAVGEFGGFAPNFNSNLDAYEIIKESITDLHKINGVDVFLGTDFSADNYYQNGAYQIRDFGQTLPKNKYYDFINSVIESNHLIYTEDPFSIDDLSNWRKIYQEKSQELYIVSDFYSSAGKEDIIKLVKEKMVNGINIKPSYYGTITETLEIVNLAKKNNLTITFGSKSSDTDDDFIADLSVGIQADFVKFGSLSRGERVVKYNRLLKIESEIIKST